ncbi:MAG TPA: phosphopantetheine-binding protein [Blastocatellia bacterium]|nr:phosphopantetheine-binding protein [Blastocatellia bacterium]
MKEGESTREFSKGAYVEHRVCSLVAANLCLERRQVHATSSFRELGVDILDFYSIILDLEVVFRLPIPDSESRRFVTVGDVVIWVLNHEQPQRFTIPVFKHKQSDHSI